MSLKRMVSVWMAMMIFAPTGMEAQDRSALVDQARAELPGSSAALDLLLQASDPDVAPLDSTWAVAVYDMAEDLINIGETDLAAVWLRWAVRHGEQWPIDRVWYSQAVEGAYDVAVEAVDSDGGLGDVSTTTDWGWPGSFDANSPGTLEVVSADPSLDLDITVEGAGAVGPDGEIDLPPRTYEIAVSAPGHDQVQVSREVLPGATTVLTFDLPPVLSAGVETRVAASLARISFTTNGQLVCTNGVIADPQGLVLTTLGNGLQQATGIEVVTPMGRFGNFVPGPSDETRGLIVLRPDETVAEAPDLGPPPEDLEGDPDGQYAWAVYQPGCADPTTARTRHTGWPDQPQGPVSLVQDLPGSASGSPLVDGSGAWLGVVTGASSVLPAVLAQELVDDARRALVVQQAGEGGVPSWIWIAGGVGAAGAACAALCFGGGDGGNGGNDTVEDTGSISITFPDIGRP